MDHVDAVFKCDSDDVVLSEVGGHWGHSFANQVGLVGFVSMSVHPVLVGVDGDGRHGELVGGTEDSDGDFTSIGDEDFFQRARGSSLLLPQPGDAGVSGISKGDSRLGRLSSWGARAGIL